MPAAEAEGARPEGSPSEGTREAAGGQGKSHGDLALTVSLVVYVVLLAIATCGEVFENDTILGWFR